jgi:hypothetical protein
VFAKPRSQYSSHLRKLGEAVKNRYRDADANLPPPQFLTPVSVVGAPVGGFSWVRSHRAVWNGTMDGALT